ncbi:MAG: hypothetical protein JWN70_849 [Planctomycetaceae bacterium]|nr:hypothetical protein [Planctomycetaceae bacterium]
MLDFLAGVEVTEAPQPLTLANPDHAPIKAHPRHQANHWTRCLQDTVGEALQKLQKTNTSTDDVDGESSNWDERTESSAAQNSQAASQPEMLLQALSLQNQEPAVAETLPELDRRGFPRRASECSVTLVERRETQLLTPQEIDLWLDAGGTAGKLLDISQTGLCLQLNREIANDSEILLRISNQKLNCHVDTTATVIHSRSTGNGRYSVHCSVLHPLTIAELQDLGRPPVAPGHVLA